MQTVNFYTMTMPQSSAPAVSRPVPAVDKTVRQQHVGYIQIGNRAFQFDFSSLESLPEDPNPNLTELLIAKYWNHFSIQLGHWNTLKVIVMDCQMFSLMPDHTKAGVLNTMKLYLGGADAMYARDADNGQVLILGPRKLMESNITVVAGTAVWDPKKRIAQPNPEAKIPRPPNAYILYRKDQQAALKAANPGIPNNDISVMTGSMWKAESPEVRADYQRRANEIKTKLMTLHPHYRYVPRRSSEIRRRTPRCNRAQGVTNASTTEQNSSVRTMGDPVVASMNQQQPLPDFNSAQNHEIANGTAPKYNNDISHLIKPGHAFSGQITKLIPNTSSFLPPISREGWTPIVHPSELQNGAGCALTPESDQQDDFIGTPSSTMHNNNCFSWAGGLEDADLVQIFGNHI